MITEFTCGIYTATFNSIGGPGEESGAPRTSFSPGFTKHEMGAFLIAQGLVSKYNLKTPEDQAIIAQLSKEMAGEILKQFE